MTSHPVKYTQTPSYGETTFQIHRCQTPQTPSHLKSQRKGKYSWLMAEIRVDPHNLRPSQSSSKTTIHPDLKFIMSNPEKAPTFPLYLPWVCHFHYTWFHYIVISQAMQLQHFFGSKKSTPTKFAPPWSQVAGTQQPGLNPLPRPLEHESLQDASPWVEQTWLRTPGKHLGWGKGIGDDSKESRQLLLLLLLLIIIIIHPSSSSSSSAFLCLSGLSTRSFKRKSKMYSWLPTNHPIRCQLTSEWSFTRITRKPYCLMVSEPNYKIKFGVVRSICFSWRMTCHPVLNNALILFQAWLQIQLPSSRIRFWRKHVNI